MTPKHNIMNFGDHLEELRRRLIFALMGPIPIFIVALIFGGPLVELLLEPARTALLGANLPAKLLATGPAESFVVYIKVAAVVSVMFSAPWILFQVWLFIAPGLYNTERRFAHLLFPLSAVLTITGLAFLYKLLLPVMLSFLIGFGISLAGADVATAPIPEGIDLPSIPVLAADPVDPTPGMMWVNGTLHELRIATGDEVMAIPMSAGDGSIVQQYRVSEYVSLCFNLGIVFTIAFQLPVVMLLGGWTGLLRPNELARWRKHVLFGSAVVSAIATPADPMSMLLLMLPLYVLFEFGLILMRIAPGTPTTDGAEGE